MPAYDLSDLRAIVVDDSAYMCRLLRTMLSGFGIREVLEASDGADALEKLNGNHVDLMVVDWEMPVLNGWELVQLVRKPEHPMAYVPIIMITGYSTEARTREAMKLGVNDVLLKPCSSKALYERVIDAIVNPRPFIRSEEYFGPKPRVERERGGRIKMPELEERCDDPFNKEKFVL
jgi:two-component system, chemotaxis family, chemotaxis protein CheY